MRRIPTEDSSGTLDGLPFFAYIDTWHSVLHMRFIHYYNRPSTLAGEKTVAENRAAMLPDVLFSSAR